MGDEVSDFLYGAHLQDYIEQCKRHGYNDPQAIMTLDVRTLEFIGKVDMQPEDVLQLRTVLLTHRRWSNNLATVPQTRVNAVAESADSAIAPPVPPSSAHNMPAPITNLGTPNTTPLTVTGLGMPRNRGMPRPYSGMPTSIPSDIGYPNYNISRDPIAELHNISRDIGAPNAIPVTGLGMPRGKSCKLPRQKISVVPGMGMPNILDLTPSSGGMPTSISLVTTVPNNISSPIIDLVAQKTIPPVTGLGMPRSNSPILLPLVTTAEFVDPTKRWIFPQQQNLLMTPRKRRKRVLAPRERTRRQTMSATARQPGVPLISPTMLGDQLTDWHRVAVPMKQGWRNKDEMHAETLKHSTQQQCGTVLSRKESGGKRRVYVCSSPGRGSRASCPYRIVWRLKVLGSRIDCSPHEYKRMKKSHGGKAWRLDLRNSQWTHDTWCTSKQNVRVTELTTDPTFVEHMTTFGTGTTGKRAAQSCIGRGGRIAGGVSTKNAKRAQNTVLNQFNTEYDDDWCKIAGWGREFVRSNPGSLFHVGKDDNNR